MSKGMGKKIGISLALALLTWLVLLLLSSVLVVNGAVRAEQIPLWLVRAAGVALGALAFMAKRPRKHKRKKRR